MNLGELIRYLRKTNGQTLSDIAEESGLSISFLSDIERGVSKPSIESLQKIAGPLGVEASALLERRSDVAPNTHALPDREHYCQCMICNTTSAFRELEGWPHQRDQRAAVAKLGRALDYLLDNAAAAEMRHMDDIQRIAYAIGLGPWQSNVELIINHIEKSKRAQVDQPAPAAAIPQEAQT